MSARAARAGGRRRRGGGGGHEENDERWLLTYADMITLLLALFMVLFSISSVNVSKFETLQRVLAETFTGKVMPGGKALQQTAASDESKQPSPTPPIPSIAPPSVSQGSKSERKKESERRKKEQEELEALKRKIDEYAKQHGLDKQIETSIAARGLVIRILTDDVLFDSGKAAVKPEGRPLLARIAELIRVDALHPLAVEGHTDNLPIASEYFPSNWELSSARASSVVRLLVEDGVRPSRVQATGFAAEHPIASNDDEAGRNRNRRVEIVVLRRNSTGTGGPAQP